MSIKKLLNQQSESFISLHELLVYLTERYNDTTYQEAAKLLYRFMFGGQKGGLFVSPVLWYEKSNIDGKRSIGFNARRENCLKQAAISENAENPDSHILGFDKQAIFSFLKQQGLDVEVIKEEKELRWDEKWKVDFQYVTHFDKKDAAYVMSGLNPDEARLGDLWENPPARVKAKLKLIDAHAGELLQMSGLQGGTSSGDAIIHADEPILQDVWRKWCVIHGFEWPMASIPVSSTHNQTEMNPDSLEVLRSRIIELNESLASLQNENRTLKEQVKTLDSVYLSLVNTFNQRAIQRTCTAATNDARFLAYLVATPRQRLR